jgi:manganese-dependent inorganic pyrophosphatase
MSENVTYVTGHRNPDTDSICSAIAYANLKNKLGFNIEPVRLGKLNIETQFILDYLNVPAPKYISDVKAKVDSMEYSPINTIKITDSLKKAWDSLNYETNNKIVAVVDEKSKYIGTITVSDILRVLIENNDENMFEKNNTTLENIIEVLDGEFITKSDLEIVKGTIKIGSSLEQIKSANLTPNDILITDAAEYMAEASIKESGARIIILDSSINHTYSSNLLSLAESNRCTLIKTPYNTFTIVKLLAQSIQSSTAVQVNNLPIVYTNEYIDEVKEIVLNSKHRSFPVLNLDRTVAGAITGKNLLNYKRTKVILVDHSEKSQSVSGLNEAELIEIIDHHRLGDVETSKPIFMRCQPLGSTATIVAMMYFENKIRLSAKYAGLMLSAIISDTLLFKSPTCTETDKQVAERLAKIAKLDIETYGLNMLKAGASLEGRSISDILTTDTKNFNISGLTVAISQINTMNYEEFIKNKKDFLNEMENLRKDKEIDLFVFMITDLLREGSLIIYSGNDTHIVQKAFDIEPEHNSKFLAGVVSRKKQMVPKLVNVAGILK